MKEEVKLHLNRVQMNQTHPISATSLAEEAVVVAAIIIIVIIMATILLSPLGQLKRRS